VFIVDIDLNKNKKAKFDLIELEFVSKIDKSI
jgi:hypothetical protein